MGVLKKLIFRMKRNVVKYMTLSTTSVSATWSPASITNTGVTLTWDVTGDIAPTSQNVDDPTFDLSANTGTVNMNVYDVIGLTNFQIFTFNLTALDISGAINLITFQCTQNSITTLDVSKNIALQSLQCARNSITTLDVSLNTSLVTLQCFINNITTLNISLNTSLRELGCYGNNQTATVTDQIFIDLDTNGVINGTLNIRNNRTAASDTARANLITKGWTITDTYTT